MRDNVASTHSHDRWMRDKVASTESIGRSMPGIDHSMRDTVDLMNDIAA